MEVEYIMANEDVFPVDAEDDDVMVTLSLDDGTEQRCEILTIFEVEKLGRDYIVLLPVDDNDQPCSDGEVYIYRYEEDEEGSPWLDNIASDDEYAEVTKVFETLEWEEDEEE